MLFYSTIVISALVSLIYYIKVYNKMTDESFSPPKGIFLYPLILFLCWLPAIIDCIYTEIMLETAGVETLRMIHLLASHSQGLLNAICYGVLQRVSFVKNRIHRIISN
jgi:hypothetical protein